MSMIQKIRMIRTVRTLETFKGLKAALNEVIKAFGLTAEQAQELRSHFN